MKTSTEAAGHRPAALIPLAATAAVAVIGGSAFVISTMGPGTAGPSPESSAPPPASQTPTAPHPTHTPTVSNEADDPADDPAGDPAGDARLMRKLGESGYPQRPASDSDRPAVTSRAALEAARGSNVDAAHVVGLMWVGTRHHPDDDGGTSAPRITWRLTWAIASGPHDAPPPIAPPIDAPPETGPPAQMQSVVLVDAHSGEVWGWLGL